jgi:hypothetical protein
MKIIVTMDWIVCPGKVGELEVFNSRGTETYQFTYTTEWAKKGFQIDPTLDLLAGFTQHSQKLPGVFQDISPDRWGRLVQKRANSGFSARRSLNLLMKLPKPLRGKALRVFFSQQIFLAKKSP